MIIVHTAARFIHASTTPEMLDFAYYELPAEFVWTLRAGTPFTVS